LDDIDLLSLDVGQSAHHGHGLTPAGKKVFDKQLPNSEPKLRAVFEKLAAKFGTVPVRVDQPASIGPCPIGSPGPPAARSPTCPTCPCGGSPIPTRESEPALVPDNYVRNG
jgi:hypothetical protein